MRSTTLVLMCIALLLAVFASADTHIRHGKNAVAQDPQGRHAQQYSPQHGNGGAYVARRQNFFRNVGNTFRSIGHHVKQKVQKVANWGRNVGQHINRGVQTAQRWIGRGQQVMDTVHRGKGLIQQVGGFFGRGLRDGQSKDNE
ncbi:hypothetical protein H310_15070 [Aphanomyces invadans]|uniref:Uncharacterized protein n=1 Tax=Aphanomyces invadans TaxID=157072 RepID=A0A024T9S7_9STRA|nr:hypothetical protein H310_15070 [Aphanomyces invadans]ETV90097.1 hypothetical protein H310_15070 [Aphanomyces invadans]|eukprot:XP_008881270.1 hypothetical protein H310_15070 [Aphanomyces invadans]